MKGVKLTGELIEAFAGTFLSPRYDNPMPTPPFHREAWSLYASNIHAAGCVAPRDHAKSTGLTFDYCLAEVCFRSSDYVIIISASEDKAIEQLSNISDELHDNVDLREQFDIGSFEVDQKSEIVVACKDGHRFRILARGAEQKIRGALWKGKRPNLILCDDMEDDEQVESIERRKKFRRWFFRAAKQSLSKTGKIRVHGTILHEDSLLARLLKNKAWEFLFYKAHESYNDFHNILWPQRWTEQQLRYKRKEFEEDGDPGGYAQEFLNDPQDMEDAYLRKDQFLGMTDSDHELDKLYYAGCDFAVSKKDRANRTSFTVGGSSLGANTFIVDQFVDRWDTLEWIIQLLQLQQKWNPQIVFVEGGQIWNSVWPLIRNEMADDTRSPVVRAGRDDMEGVGNGDIYINFEVLNPVKDKGVRGRAFQKRMKAGTVRFDKQASWYGNYEQECLKFTGVGEAKLDDQFDSTATLFIGLDKLPPVEEEDFDEVDPLEEEEYFHMKVGKGGRSETTGY